MASRKRVFISYSRTQGDIAHRLAQDLERGRPAFPVWIDDQRLEIGDPLDSGIERALQGCRAMILLWSSAALASRYVQTEWLGACELGKRIMTCTLDDTPVPLILQSAIFDRLDGRYEETLTRLRRALAEPATPQPVVAAAPVATVEDSLAALTQRQINDVIAALVAGSPEAAAVLQRQLDPTIAGLVRDHPRDPRVLALAGYHQKNAYMIAKDQAADGQALPADDPRLVEAEAYFQRSLSIDPADPSALNGLGNIYYYRGDLGAAEFFTRRAIDRAGGAYGFAESDLALILDAKRQSSPPRARKKSPRTTTKRTDGDGNLEIARRYLAALESDAGAESFFAPDVIQEEFPNRFVPAGARRDLAALREAAQRGRAVMRGQRYVVRAAYTSGETVILEVLWVGTLAVPVGSLPAGGEMRAHFAVFLEFRDGLIVRQRNYDCFEPF